MIKLKSLLNSHKPLNENLIIDPAHLKPKVEAFVNALVTDGVFTSYNRKLSSGQMNPVDFTNDLVHKILSSVQEWVKTVNDRGDWENDEGGMIKEESAPLICFYDSTPLDMDDAGKRDTETMGGLDVDYYICPKCNTKYSYTLDSLDGNSLCVD